MYANIFNLFISKYTEVYIGASKLNFKLLFCIIYNHINKKYNLNFYTYLYLLLYYQNQNYSLKFNVFFGCHGTSKKANFSTNNS